MQMIEYSESHDSTAIDLAYSLEKKGRYLKKGVNARTPRKKESHIGIMPNLKEIIITISIANKFGKS